MASSVVLALMLSSQISAGCTSAEPPADDIALMAGLARDAAPAGYTDETRTSITMHAELCTPRDWNILNIRYEQLYPEQNSITAHSARDRIVCTLSRATDPQGLTSISTRCEHTVRKMLSYPGIDEPVELVSHDYQLGFELAERFLGFLSGYVAQAVHGRELARGEFRGIDRIHAFEGSGSKILFSARVFSDSCRSETVGAAYDPETGNFTFRGFSSVIC